jgi:FkbM family methyltransferase
MVSRRPIRPRRRLIATRAWKLWNLASRPGLARTLRHGVVPSVESVHVPFAEPRTVLDVGASRGQFAALARWLWPEARIICFEPLPAALKKLNALAPTLRLEVRPIALDTSSGTARIHVSHSDDSSSLLPISERQVHEFPSTFSIGTAPVDTSRLDDLSLRIGHPALLKIDTQGAELRVLQGAVSTLEDVDTVYVECSYVELYHGQALADEVISFLADQRLRLAGVYNVAQGRNGMQLQADFLFRRA